MTGKFFKAALLTMGLMAGSAVSAATVDFVALNPTDSTSPSQLYGSGLTAMEVFANGPTVANPSVPLVGALVAARNSTTTYRGLGVEEDAGLDKGAESLAKGEELQFHLADPNAYVASISLSRRFVAGDQGFDLFLTDGITETPVFSGLVTAVQDGTAASSQTFAIPAAYQNTTYGSVFIVRATSSGNPKGIYVNALEIAETAPVVPLPASLPLLAGALAIGGFAVRRRRKAA